MPNLVGTGPRIALRAGLALATLTFHGLGFQAAPGGARGPNNFVVTEGRGSIEIRQGDQDWVISLQDLPIRSVDCEPPECADNNSGGCAVSCINGSKFLTMDEEHRVIYFAVATGPGQNKPWILFGYRLDNREVFRLANEYGGGLGAAVVSSDGRYLAYVMYAHTPVVCPQSSYLGVVDTQERRSVGMAAADRRPGSAALITAIRWSGPLEVTYDEEVLPADTCGAFEKFPQHLTGSLDIRPSSIK